MLKPSPRPRMTHTAGTASQANAADEARSFLQRRLGFLGKFGFALTLAFYIASLAVAAFSSVPSMSAGAETVKMLVML